MKNVVALIAASCVLLLGGCSQPVRDAATSPPAEAEDFGELPGLKKTDNALLREHLARIVEQQATPELLNRPEVAADDNVAVVLIDLFPRAKLKSILEKAEAILPPRKKFEYDPVRLQKAIEFRKLHDAKRLEAREAVARPQCDFGIQFKAGYLAELDFIDMVKICFYLEAFQAAEALGDGDLDGACEALEFMLCLTTLLGAEKHLDARLEAAYLRTDAYCVLQAVTKDRRIRPEHLVRLYEIVKHQLKHWPGDADAWIGERAMGLHAYELVRTGNLDLLLTVEDLEQFEAEGSLAELAKAARRIVDDDELYYLETMAKVIESCRRPFHLRLETLDGIRIDLQAKRNSADFPLVAGRLLLKNVRRGQAIQAQDRANWEAWATALAAATGQPPVPYKTNPLTGREYSQTRLESAVEIGNIGTGIKGDDPKIRVPVFEPGGNN